MGRSPLVRLDCSLRLVWIQRPSGICPSRVLLPAGARPKLFFDGGMVVVAKGAGQAGHLAGEEPLVAEDAWGAGCLGEPSVVEGAWQTDCPAGEKRLEGVPSPPSFDEETAPVALVAAAPAPLPVAPRAPERPILLAMLVTTDLKVFLVVYPTVPLLVTPAIAPLAWSAVLRRSFLL